MSSLTFTIIQTNLHWEDKGANLAMLEQKINSIQEPAEVIVLPEMFSTGFSMQPQLFAEGMNGETMQWIKRIALQKKAIITGSIIIQEEGHYYNRLIWMLPNGSYGCYDKRHLFAYAGEDQHYTPGNKRMIASVKGWKINLQICYDLRFPVWARQAPLSTRGVSEEKSNAFNEAYGRSPAGDEVEYDVLLYVANWPERRNYPWQALLLARAIENQCYVIGVNRIGADGNNIAHCGNSMVIDALGNVLYQKQNEEAIFTITLQKEALLEVRKKFPFLHDADYFNIINE